jgi:hypothetical protein
MLESKHTLTILSCIFAFSFLLKILPLFFGNYVPYGYVDPQFHISSAMDLSEGNFGSMIHPWWHLKNHLMLDGRDVVDREAASFFYPPLLHFFLAAGYLFFHPGIWTILIISSLYSLSVIAMFLICRSFNLSRESSLIASLLVGTSEVLVKSQNMGFWTFAIALNFAIISCALLRKKSSMSTVLSIVFFLLSLLTHWAFLLPAVVIGLFEHFISKNRFAKSYIASVLAFSAPFIAIILYFSSPFLYIGTYFQELILPSFPIIVLAFIGCAINFKKYLQIALFAFLSLGLSLVCYLTSIRFIFADMIQFSFPFFASFFAASLFENVKGKAKAVLAIFVIVIVAFGCFKIFINDVTSRSTITNVEFNQLLDLRAQFLDEKNTIITTNLSEIRFWLTIVSKDSKMIYPFTHESEDMKKYYANYVLRRSNQTANFSFFEIKRQDNRLILSKDEYYLVP